MESRWIISNMTCYTEKEVDANDELHKAGVGMFTCDIILSFPYWLLLSSRALVVFYQFSCLLNFLAPTSIPLPSANCVRERSRYSSRHDMSYTGTGEADPRATTSPTSRSRGSAAADQEAPRPSATSTCASFQSCWAGGDARLHIACVGLRVCACVRAYALLCASVCGRVHE